MNSNCWIWQQPDWPAFRWQDAVVQPLLRQVRLQLGILLGSTMAASQQQSTKAALDILLSNIIASSAIENERLNAASVRSSLARRLGVTEQQTYPVSDRSEGLASIMLDALQQSADDMTLQRLLQWHRWLFPELGIVQAVKPGELRGNEPMQVVSGRHDNQLDPLLRAALSHFWFITLHPFEDGNGRIARALTDLALAQADQQSVRLYAMSVGILQQRTQYYAVLEQCQRGDMDISHWLSWFLSTLMQVLQQVSAKANLVIQKSLFWQQHQHSSLSAEQKKVLNRLLDGGDKGFSDGISAAQYQAVAKVSKATATRHLADLLNKGCLEKLPGGGRSTRYQICYPE
ncbi:Fic family protein [Rheinheimera sp. EpRS3]|uniref:Fic family protein n=1 Tax=Rheinheimera sp. EpRS3 TaxID=1712383 RepID=UPI000747066A|nr:Fic family protein [Rheinheimera sp. EpRS3]KUM51971.1 cell filamentation protein Fic [Rheinheimera sp. EpRS3]